LQLISTASRWENFNVETILSRHCQRVYTVYMHPAKILARINIIFAVFADYIDSQVEKSTHRYNTELCRSLRH